MMADTQAIPLHTTFHVCGDFQMPATTIEKRLRKNVIKNQLLSRELEFLPSDISRDDIRELARRYDPHRRRPAPARMALGAIDFFARYSAPFAGLIAGANFRAAKALYPLIGKEEQFGDSLKIFLGENVSQQVADTTKAFKVTGALVAATPDIVITALYGAVIGVAIYFVAKWMLMLTVWYGRRSRLNRKLSVLLR